MRGISRRFIDDLKNGELTFFLNEAKSNPGICLEIRRNYINLYYKGGNAIKITEKNRSYSFHFDSKYCLNKDDDQQFQYLSSLDSSDPKQFIAAWPTILSEMDSWFAAHSKPERDFQHNLIKQNQSDPIIMDIEYAGWTSNRRLFRLDMIAISQTPVGYKLIVIENKYGTGAIGGKAGLKKHYDDIVDILSEPASLNELLDSVISIANNKYELGLIRSQITREAIQSKEILFVFADFNFKSKMIANEVKRISQTVPATVLHMAADEVVINLAEAKDLFAYAD